MVVVVVGISLGLIVGLSPEADNVNMGTVTVTRGTVTMGVVIWKVGGVNVVVVKWNPGWGPVPGHVIPIAARPLPLTS